MVGEKLIRISIILPVEDSDGTNLYSRLRIKITDEFFIKFGGSTQYPVHIRENIDGQYKMPSGQKENDECVEIFVAIPEKDVGWMEGFVKGFRLGTQQESIYFEINWGSEVKFL